MMKVQMSKGWRLVLGAVASAIGLCSCGGIALDGPLERMPTEESGVEASEGSSDADQVTRPEGIQDDGNQVDKGDGGKGVEGQIAGSEAAWRESERALDECEPAGGGAAPSDPAIRMDQDGTPTCPMGLGPRKKGVCEPCESDLECEEGSYCTPQVFRGSMVGLFCTQTKQARVGQNGSCSQDGAPFVDTKELISKGGVKVEFCVLRSTTCPAFRDRGEVKPSCDRATDDARSACGADWMDDGICRKLSNGRAVCTYRCLDDSDCGENGVSGTCALDEGAGESYCAL